MLRRKGKEVTVVPTSVNLSILEMQTDQGNQLQANEMPQQYVSKQFQVSFNPLDVLS
jgi:hypothetical protein